MLLLVSRTVLDLAGLAFRRFAHAVQYVFAHHALFRHLVFVQTSTKIPKVRLRPVKKVAQP
jgi:hypothetical protein